MTAAHSAWGSAPWCFGCQSREVRWHCADRGCRQVECMKCLAVTTCTAILMLARDGISRLR